MSNQTLTSAARGVPLWNRSASNDLLIGIVCILSCTLLNPFLALFSLAVIAIYFRVPTPAFFISVPIAFALFFYFRNYGVDFAQGSFDDVPMYVTFYQNNSVVSFLGIFARFVDAPNGNEPLWQLPWWLLLNVFDAPEKTFVFIHYAAIFFSLFFSFFVLSKRHFITLSLIYFFVTPLAIESVTHLWRQQLAFALFLTGVGYYMVHGRSFGRWLVYISPFMHLSLIFFLTVFIAFELYRKYVGFENPLKFILFALFNLLAITVLSVPAINYLSGIGFENVVSYLEGSGEDQTRVFVSVGFYSITLLLAQLKLKNDDTNNLFTVLLLAVFGMMLAFPGANGIYIRFLVFALPLYGLYFFRVYLMNFSARWLLPVVCFVFASGVARIYRLVLQDEGGVVPFLAFGHAFDPFMGVAKMLVSFPLS